jgi:hypothetical protein
MNNLKRFTICKLANHQWLRTSYPRGADGETSGTFLRCQRCGKEDHDAGTIARGPSGGGATGF